MIQHDHKPLKILLALQYYLPHRTGFTLHVQRIAEALADRGHQVTVVSARYDLSLPRDEQIKGVRVIRLWAPLRVSRGMIMPAFPWAVFRLVQTHDVVSLHTPTLETAVYGFYTKLLRKGLIITHHGDLVLPAGRFNRFVEWFTFQLYKIAAKAAYHILAYTEDYVANSYYLNPFREKVVAVYPPIVLPTPQPEVVKALRQQWLGGTATHARLIGYAGRFVEEKRPDILIRALPTIHEHYPDAKIIMAGQFDIKYENFYERNWALIEQYRQHLVFLGVLTDEQDLANFYAACDVLALPSDTDNFPLVQVEAMRCGTPVVGTNIPGARVAIQASGMGELVPPRNPEAMGQAIKRVLEHREAYIKPLAQIDATFNLQKTVGDYERYLYQAATTARKRD